MRQEMMGLWNGSGISWTMCKQTAPRSRHFITQFVSGQMLFLTPNQECQSTDGITEHMDIVQINYYL